MPDALVRLLALRHVVLDGQAVADDSGVVQVGVGDLAPPLQRQERVPVGAVPAEDRLIRRVAASAGARTRPA